MNTRALFQVFQEGFRAGGESISIIINTILLTLLYILGIGATSLGVKIYRKNLLDMKIDTSKHSYWEDHPVSGANIEDYYKQF